MPSPSSGPAGIGKSRLALELAAEIAGEATVVTGSCPSYGEDVTYRPLAEIVGRLGGSDPRQRVTDLLDGDESAAQMVLAAIGLSDGAAKTEETHWAVRRMLERVARERPLVVVVEDVHWAEPTLLDLLELPRGPLERTPDPARLPHAARPARVPAGLGRAAAGQIAARAGRASGRRRSPARRERGRQGAPRRHRRAHRRAGRGESAVPRAARGRGRGQRRRDPAVDHPGRARRPHRPPGAPRARPARARVRAGPELLRGRLEALLPDDDGAGIAARLVALVQQQLVRGGAVGRAGAGRLPVRPRADPRGRVPRPAQAAARGPARARGPLAGRAGRHPRRDRRPPPRRGGPPAGRARRAPAGAGRRGGAAARGRRGRRAPAWRPVGGRAPARARRRGPDPGRPDARRAAAGARRRAVRGRSHDRRGAHARRGDRVRARAARASTRRGRARARAVRGGDGRRLGARTAGRRRRGAGARARGRRSRPVQVVAAARQSPPGSTATSAMPTRRGAPRPTTRAAPASSASCSR